MGKKTDFPPWDPRELEKKDWRTPKDRQRQRTQMRADFIRREAARADAARAMNEMARNMADHPRAPKYGPQYQAKVMNPPNGFGISSPASPPLSIPQSKGQLAPIGDFTNRSPFVNSGPSNMPLHQNPSRNPVVPSKNPPIRMVRGPNGQYQMKFDPRQAVSQYKTSPIKITGKIAGMLSKIMKKSPISRFLDVFSFVVHNWDWDDRTITNQGPPNVGQWVRVWGPCITRTGVPFGWRAGGVLDNFPCIGNQALNDPYLGNWQGETRATFYDNAPLGAPFRDGIWHWKRDQPVADNPLTGPNAPPATAPKPQAGPAPDPFRRPASGAPAPWFKPELSYNERPLRNELEKQMTDTQQSGFPIEREYELTEVSGGTRERPPTVFPPHVTPYRAPYRNEKERKVNIVLPKWFMWVWKRAMDATELDDLISILFDVLLEDLTPKEKKLIRKTGVTTKTSFIGPGVKFYSTTDKIAAVYRHWDKIDWNKAIPRLIINQVSDHVIGTLSGKGGKFLKEQEIYGFGNLTG